MKLMEQVYQTIHAERQKAVAQFQEAKDALKPLHDAIQIEEVMAAVAARCPGASRYPSHEDLGLSVTQLLSGEGLDEKLRPFVEENRKHNGHVDLMLKSVRKSPEELNAIRLEMKRLADIVVLALLRADQYETILVAMTQMDADLTDPEAIAKLFCESNLAPTASATSSAPAAP